MIAYLRLKLFIKLKPGLAIEHDQWDAVMDNK